MVPELEAEVTVPSSTAVGTMVLPVNVDPPENVIVNGAVTEVPDSDVVGIVEVNVPLAAKPPVKTAGPVTTKPVLVTVALPFIFKVVLNVAACAAAQNSKVVNTFNINASSNWDVVLKP